MKEPKIFEVHSDKINCFVCAKDKDHALEVVSYESEIKVIVILSIKEVPKELYHNFTMEREDEEGTEMLNFNTYIEEVRGIDDWEIVCTIDAP